MLIKNVVTQSENQINRYTKKFFRKSGDIKAGFKPQIRILLD